MNKEEVLPGQLQLFDTKPIEVEVVDQEALLLKKVDGKTCSGCQHIIAIQFNSCLFFCPKQKGGQYGKKIKKSEIACGLYEEASEEYIRTINGRWGYEEKGRKR